jgi:1,4-alpha-glucan branching enzyme
MARPATSSWGFEGYFDVWANGSNDWIYPHLHEAERTMTYLAAANPGADGLLRRTLNQCARELMLAQGSDWPFLISVGTAPHYAARRINEHLSRLRSFAEQVRGRRIADEELALLESRDNIFSALDYSLYSPE